MKIAIIGASGTVGGNRILEEAIHPRHEVTAIVRDTSKLKNSNVSVVEKNIFDLTPDDLEKFDMVVNAIGAPIGEEQAHVNAGRILIEALKGSTTRAIIMGGAGSLYIDEKKYVKVMETPDSLELFLPNAKGQARNLEDLQATSAIKWTFINPSAFFDAEGLITGSYQVGKDQFLVNSKEVSYISYADYAIAVIN